MVPWRRLAMIHRLRPADSSDFDWLLALPRGPALGSDSVGDAERRARFTRAFGAQPWWVVEVERQPVGALSVAWDEDPIVLHTVAVTPAWQGRGLGTRLLHDVLLQARELARPVVAELPPDDPARGLLQRLGFWPAPDETGTSSPTRLRWEASIRTDVTLRAAMSPWADPMRRRAWARRLFEGPVDDAVGFCRFGAGRYGVPAQPSALVMGCGTGRLLRPLAQLGWSLTAYEEDPDLRVAAARLAATGPAAGPPSGPRSPGSITVRDGDFGELNATHAFDLAIAMHGTLWHVLSHEARVDAASRLRRALRPGGVLLVEGPNMPWVLRAHREPPATTEIYHRATVSRIPSHAIDFHEGVLEHRDLFVVEVDDEEASEHTDVRRWALMGLPLCRLALQQAGLQVLETFRDLGATGPSRVSGPRVVLAAVAPS
ncbi:GNAT family N-acetyltransferase [Paraliomyxa miuraensis]|uniref:GNAT family N-acetyltransferase n=1 Tax=Paraliomyxa miuraensis TaxID=376150 RepID=UPI002255C18D|nr:GNAT family N-acetyltransferase [Paraliomyxa miuraensis]MCX4245674.1 GNAT family N-acetyltransferase [Paraliomyxa miuraensis]